MAEASSLCCPRNARSWGSAAVSASASSSRLLKNEGRIRLGIAGGREQDKSPLEHGVPRPRRDRQDAEASGLPTQPLAVAPARPRPPRLRFTLPREVVAPDLFLVVLVDE